MVRLRGEVHRLIAPRDQKYQSNFVEFRNHKVVYRRYAGLFFCVCVDADDNELAYLEAIHLFVEVLSEVEETSKDVVLARLEELEKLE
ncbi:AP-2 complex subunit sigma [Trametes pubescens]|uniref:AP-2 complex subunit sigma n=1 Tax=Trametes pubescens TaxID=154538 RepID=A0A1M2VVS9_TRAPU|nr:AP-2 complex subunit sigma [Trametes pubescens]